MIPFSFDQCEGKAKVGKENLETWLGFRVKCEPVHQQLGAVDSG